MTKAQKTVSRKALAAAIYHIDPFDVMAEAKAIARVTAFFRKSKAPALMLEYLLQDLQSTARQKKTEHWRDISHFLENVQDMLKELNAPAEPSQ